MSTIDPDASIIMALSAERLADRETIKAQQDQIVALIAVLKAQERSVHVLTHLVSDLLAQERG